MVQAVPGTPVSENVRVFVSEEVEFEQFLKPFVDDPKEYACMFQTHMHHVYVRRITECKQTLQHFNHVIMDRGSGTWAFCTVQNRLGYISDGQMALLRVLMSDLYEAMLRSSSGFPMYVYCNAKPKTCYERIRVRNREGELELTLEYLEHIHRAHVAQILIAVIHDTWTLPCVVDFDGDRVHPDELSRVVALHQDYMGVVSVHVPQPVRNMSHKQIEDAVFDMNEDQLDTILALFVPDNYMKHENTIIIPDISQ